MKKIIVILSILGLFVLSSNAQLNSAYAFDVDTVTNADTISFSTAKLTGEYDLLFQVIPDNVSGTSAGDAVLYKSIDNSNFFSTGDTVDISGIGEIIEITNANGLYYKLEVISSGTHVTEINASYLVKPE